jgi:hypothetical protein
MESCFVSQRFSLCHSFASARNRCRASDGGNIFSAKLLATAAKSFWLKVTNRSARPLTAVSSTHHIVSRIGQKRSPQEPYLHCFANSNERINDLVEFRHAKTVYFSMFLARQNSLVLENQRHRQQKCKLSSQRSIH